MCGVPHIKQIIVFNFNRAKSLSTTNNYCRVFLHSGGGRISGAFMTYFLTNLTAIKINFKIQKLPNYSRIF
jgi:hypothetical protein